jgi:hypothetical protein
MSLSRLSVLLILYVAADFANPLMPGAVTFLNGSVEAVHVERARFLECAPGAPVLAPHEGVEVARLTCPAPHPRPLPPAARLWLVPVPRAQLVESGPPPPSEAH